MRFWNAKRWAVFMGVALVGSLAFTGVVYAQSITIVEPAEGATIWGDVINLRWVSDGIEITAADGQQVPGVGHYHIILIPRREAKLPLEPGEPIGQGDNIVHTTETGHRFENMMPGPYTAYLVIGDGLHIPLDPQVMDVVHLELTSDDPGSGLQDTPWWLVGLIVGGILAVAFFVTR